MSVSAPTPEVPIDWEIAKTGDVCEVQNGYAFKSEFFNDKYTGLPLIRIRDVHSGRSDTFYSGPFDERYVVTDDDLLIGMDGEFRVRKWRSGKGLLNQRVCRLIPNGETMAADFLYYSIGRPLKQIENFTPFTTVKHISAGQIRAIELPLPPIPEQKKIAHILSTVQRAIEAQERIIQTTTELKKALMHKLFTEGLRNEPQKQTEIGLVPASWQLKPMTEICHLIIDCPHTTPNFQDSGVLIARNFNFKDARFIPEPAFYTSEDEYLMRVKRAAPAPGDVLFSREAPIGEACVIPPDTRLSLGQRTMFLRTKQSLLLPEFLVYSFYSENVRRRMLATAGGLTLPHLNVGDVRKFPIPVPSLQDQEEISHMLLSIERKAELHRRHCSSLQDLFRTFLHELMTAKTRVHELEITV